MGKILFVILSFISFSASSQIMGEDEVYLMEI